MKIEVLFPRTMEGQRVSVFEVDAIPTVKSCITTDGEDCWDVETVIYSMDAKTTDGIVAQLRVR